MWCEAILSESDNVFTFILPSFFLFFFFFSRSRCIAVCSLGLWVCEELMQANIHDQVKDAINVLGVTLKVSG